MKNLALIFFGLLLFLFLISATQTKDNFPHGKLKIPCDQCHTTKGWQVIQSQIKFKHENIGFPLTGNHRLAACLDCHNSMVFSHVAVTCADCHTDIHLGQLGVNCENCHTPQNWENRSEALEQHNRFSFPLLGVHALVDCEGCHYNQQRSEFALTPTECKDCHLENFNYSKNPDHKLAKFSITCEECHTTGSVNWSETSYQHPSLFILRNAHSITDCNSCHITDYFGIGHDCFDCHKIVYNNTLNPNHVLLGFRTDCEICHNENGWENAKFNHFEASGFQLIGVHQTLQCTECHLNNQTGQLSRDCYGCHKNDFKSVSDPNHVQNNFDFDCTKCHNDTKWSPTFFNHNDTQFPLTGAHTSVACIDCHATGYTTIATDCYSCHQTDYTDVTDPNHVQNNFDFDCTKCHDDTKWSPAFFDHNATQFPLTDAHTSVSCIDCHSTGYSETPDDCYSCHQDDFNNVSDPNHVQNNFDFDCTKCHDNTKWSPALFDHTNTQFPLTGAHALLSCIDCHSTGYSATPDDCYSCHQDDFNNVSDPNHVQNNFDFDCTKCHDNTKWSPALFDHTNTQFPLTGAHSSVSCIDCHSTGYSATPDDCYSCHQDDFNNVSDPNHVQNNFDFDCTKCHDNTKWSPAIFDHNQTQFSLAGAHTSVSCIDCHSTGYSATPDDCYSCHQDDFNNVSDPNHVQNNFDFDCAKCHDNIKWSPATFDHNQTQFPLTGAHVNTDCQNCHAQGYSGIPKVCFACHEDKYNNTTDPNHITAQFLTQCEDCHNTKRWDETTWDHDTQFFPIYSGEHEGEWNTCFDCHVNQSNYNTFECIYCHKHRQSKMDEEHDEEPGYQYISIRCYECHPTGDDP